MSPSETTIDLTQAQNWTEELLLKAVQAGQQSSPDLQHNTSHTVANFLGAEGRIGFTFDELVKFLGDNMAARGNGELFLTAMNFLLARGELEGKNYQGDYVNGLTTLQIQKPEVPTPQAIPQAKERLIPAVPEPKVAPKTGAWKRLWNMIAA